MVLFKGLPKEQSYGMDHVPNYPAEDKARIYAEATNLLTDRFARLDGLELMTILAATEHLTALDGPPQAIDLSAVEFGQAMMLRESAGRAATSSDDARAVINALATHLNLFFDRLVEPQRDAKAQTLAIRTRQSLRMRFTSYPHHIREIYDEIWKEVDRFSLGALGIGLGHAARLAMGAAFSVMSRLQKSAEVVALGKWMAGDSLTFNPSWLSLFEIDMQAMNAVVPEIPRDTFLGVFDRLAMELGDLRAANFDHLHLNNPVWSKPFVRDAGRYFCFSPKTLFSSHDAVLAELAKAIWPEPNQVLGEVRGKVLERLLAETLTRILPHARLWTSARWTDPRDGRGYQTDAIVLIDGIVLLFEAKGHALSAAARRGSNDWFKAFDDIVVSACVQATRLEQLLRDRRETHIHLETDQGKVSLQKDTIRHVQRFGVSLERLTMASLKCDEPLLIRIQRAGAMPMPIMPISDLWLLEELLESEGRRLHYLLRRAEIEAQVSFVGDELDLIAWYLRSGFIGFHHSEDVPGIISIYGLSDFLGLYMKNTAHYDARITPPQRTIMLWNQFISEQETYRRPGWTDRVYDLLNIPLQSQQRFLNDLIQARRKVRRKQYRGLAPVLMQQQAQHHPSLFVGMVAGRLSSSAITSFAQDLFAESCAKHPDERVFLFYQDAAADQIQPGLLYYRGVDWNQKSVPVPIEGNVVGADFFYSVNPTTNRDNNQ
jgi:hypothetical protein